MEYARSVAVPGIRKGTMPLITGCTSFVGAKVNILYHTGSASETIFDETNAARFTAPGAYILKPGEELVLKKGQ